MAYQFNPFTGNFDISTGSAGPQGLSAYEVAAANGFTGTEAEWLAGLTGPQGEPGLQGVQGEPGIITRETIVLALGYTPADAAALGSIDAVLDSINGVTV